MIPDEIRELVRNGTIARGCSRSGQGTAAVAGQALAAGLDALTPNGEIEVEAVLATELSGFGCGPT